VTSALEDPPASMAAVSSMSASFSKDGAIMVSRPRRAAHCVPEASKYSTRMSENPYSWSLPRRYSVSRKRPVYSASSRMRSNGPNINS